MWQHAFQSHTWRECGFLCVFSLACIDASGTSGSFLFLWSYVCFGNVFICTMRAITSVYKHDSASLSSREAAAVALPDLAGFVVFTFPSFSVFNVLVWKPCTISVPDNFFFFEGRLYIEKGFA